MCSVHDKNTLNTPIAMFGQKWFYLHVIVGLRYTVK